MQKITVYQCHTPQQLFDKVAEFKEAGKHPFSVAKMNGDADDWHGDPTYLLDAPIGFSTRPENAVKNFKKHYNIVDIPPEKVVKP